TGGRVGPGRARLASREAARWQSRQKLAGPPCPAAEKSVNGLAWPQVGRRLLGACWPGEQEPLGSSSIRRVPFFVAVEGFARVLAPVVVTHHRGRCSSRWRQRVQERDGGSIHWTL